MPTSHLYLFEVDLAADGSELSSARVPKLSRRYSRLIKKINTMALPLPDVWTCPACSYSENAHDTTCEMCQAARPQNTRSVLLVDKNSTHPVAVAARRVSGRLPPKARAAAPARESPSRGAKDAANERIAAQLGVVPVAAVVHSPVSSPDGPLVPPPAVARAVTKVPPLALRAMLGTRQRVWIVVQMIGLCLILEKTTFLMTIPQPMERKYH